MDILSLILLKWAGSDKLGAISLLKEQNDEDLVARVKAYLPPSDYTEFDTLITQ
jgi:hypothetical protein